MFQKDVRNCRLHVRLSQKEKSIIDTYCASLGCGVSDMIRGVILDYIEKHPIDISSSQQDTNESLK